MLINCELNNIQLSAFRSDSIHFLVVVALEVFKGNQAVAGADVYGGFIDSCYTNNSLNSNSTVLFNSITNSTHPLQISATPYQVCPCIDGTMDFSLQTVAFQVLPGQEFNISVVTTGQRNGVVPTNIVLSIDDSNSLHLHVCNIIGYLKEAILLLVWNHVVFRAVQS